MAKDQDKQDEAQNADAGGQEAEAGQEDALTFTPQTLSRRLEREQRKAAEDMLAKLGVDSIDDATAIIQSQREADEARKSELQKAQERIQALEQEAQQAQQQMRQTALRSAFEMAAARAGAAHPEDAIKLVGSASDFLDTDGNPVGVEDAVSELVDSGRLPVERQAQAPRLNAGAGSGAPTGKKVTLSEAEIELATKLGVSPERYAARKAEAGRA